MNEESKAPLIGQFSGPPGNAPRLPADLPRKTASPEATPPEMVKEAAVQKDDNRKEEDDRPRPKTPQEKAADYQAGLVAVGLTGIAARGILEKVLVDEVYEEKIKMGPIDVVVRTRNYKDVQRTLRFLELEKPTYALGINDLVARYNMAASLSSYGEHKFTHPSKKNKASDDDIENAFHERLSFIMELPVVAVDRLQQIVHDFDQKIGAVFAEGSPEDF
jgi:hypothetical protein